MLKAKASRRFNVKRSRTLYAMCAIPVLLVFVFSYLPMFGLIIAFKNYRYDLGIWGSKWVGLKNFEFLKSKDFARVIWNTLSLNFIFIIVGLVAAVFVAILLFHIKSRKWTKLFQTSMITPHFLSWVVAGYMVYAFLHPEYGLINRLLETVGIGTVNWYVTPNAWPVILTIASVWKFVGMDSVIYYSALMAIDSSYFEAARIDGAGSWRIALHIILPCLIPLISIMTILKIGGIMRADFGLFYQLTRNSGLLYPRTDVVDTYIFRALRDIGDMGMSSAAGFFQSIVGLVLVLVTNYVSKKIDSDNALF